MKLALTLLHRLQQVQITKTIQMRGDRLFINQEGMVPDAATAPQGTKRLVTGESEADAH